MTDTRRDLWRYEWRPGYRTKVDANVAGEEIQRIEAERGIATPAIVIEESRPETAPLHSEFEWDDGIAAERYRIGQAAGLIHAMRKIRIVGPSEPKPIPEPAFVAIRVRHEPPAARREPPTSAQERDRRDEELGAGDDEREMPVTEYGYTPNTASMRRVFLLSELAHVNIRLSRSAAYPEMEPVREAVRQVRESLRD